MLLPGRHFGHPSLQILPVVPGSMMIPELKKPLSITRQRSSIQLAWPTYLTGYVLEHTATSWQVRGRLSPAGIRIPPPG
jgi:hypothetical protein